MEFIFIIKWNFRVEKEFFKFIRGFFEKWVIGRVVGSKRRIQEIFKDVRGFTLKLRAQIIIIKYSITSTCIIFYNDSTRHEILQCIRELSLLIKNKFS